ncbi:respiratory nitrate reductase subunit gamma [bacterium]|nr:respiratory nitrate reductase subunit gamma [bacterium]
MHTLDTFFFVIFPYVAVFVFVIGYIFRWQEVGFKVSSLSSQFLEGDRLFWGIVPLHFGLIVLALGHLSAWLLPGTTLLWNSQPVRLLILEVTAFTFGLSVLCALVWLLYRRATDARIKAVTSQMDVYIEVILLIQVILGCWIALGYRWGSSWFASGLSPYLWSLVKFNPDILAVSAMPHVIKAHIIGAFLILLMVPFTRLIHFMVAPLHYIARPFQVVYWNWNRGRIRDPRTPWSEARPKNN